MSDIIRTPIKLETAHTIKDYIFGGQAKITVVSNKTNVDLAFKIIDAQKGRFWVYVRYEMDPKPQKRKSDKPFQKIYRGHYIGTIFNNKWYPKDKSNKFISQRAFSWIWRFLSKDEVPKGCCIYHHGTCRRCGRDITAITSIMKGIGPCCEKMVKEQLSKNILATNEFI